MMIAAVALAALVSLGSTNAEVVRGKVAPVAVERAPSPLLAVSWKEVRWADFLERTEATPRAMARSIAPEVKALRARYGSYARVYDAVKAARRAAGQ